MRPRRSSWKRRRLTRHLADKEFLEAKKAQNKMQKMYKDAMSKPKGAKPKPKLKGSSDEKPKEKVTWTQPGMRGRPPNWSKEIIWIPADEWKDEYGENGEDDE